MKILVLSLGKAFKKALGEEKSGIKRFGSAFAPMEATVGLCVIDISGEDFLNSNGQKAGYACLKKATEGIRIFSF